MHEIELILGLLIPVLLLASLAERLGIAYPILLVLGGLGLGFLPGLPRVELEPDLVFLLFLPPIIFSAAYNTSWRDLRANLRPIGLLAVGLVLTTTVAVAAVAQAVVPGLGWAVAFVLGAIVSPPDAVATTAIVGRLGVPRRIVTVLEGESLLNDATALVAYTFAVTAVVTGSFSLAEAGARFVVAVGGGVALGAGVGWLLTKSPRLLGDDPLIETTATLLAPIAAYLPAEALGVSGVLATATAGLILGRRAPEIFTPAGRLRGETVWEYVVFLINGLIFILIGLQLPTIIQGLAGRSPSELVAYAAAVCLTAILVRIVWVFPATYLPRWLIPGLAGRDPSPPWQYPAVLAWAGLRGGVTLAAALALPRATAAGESFPNRELVIFLAFCVILATLVGQGLTLPLLIRRLGLADDGSGEREELLARREAASAALLRLDELDGEDWVPSEVAAALRGWYAHRLEHVPDSPDGKEAERDHLAAHDRLLREAIEAERRTLVGLRNRGLIGDEALRRVEYDLDLAEVKSTE